MGRNPEGAQGRDHPNGVFGAQSHNALRSKQQLILGVGMFADDVSIGKIGRDACDLSEEAAVARAQDAVALMRHFLSR